MKTFLLIWCILTGIHASDTRFVYVGRHQVDSTTVSMDYTGTYVRVRYYGTRLCVRLHDSGKNYWNLYVDREFTAEPDRIFTTSGDTTVVLFGEEARGRKGEKAKEHTIMLYKRTEGEQGRATFYEFFTDGEVLQAQPLKPRQMEFIGDSYTCGYAAENTGPNDKFSPVNETSAKTYAAVLARYFDADFTLVAHSGMGIARNYNSKFPGWYMPDRYTQTFDMDSTSRWNATRYTLHATRYTIHYTPLTHHPSPSITVILLGGNDFSKGQQPSYEAFSANYFRMLRQIKANYGEDYPILCCVKKGNEDLTDYVRRVVKDCGLKNVHFCPFYPAVFGEGEKYIGANHPNYLSHRHAAHVLIPYIATLTGWPLTDRPIY